MLTGVQCVPHGIVDGANGAREPTQVLPDCRRHLGELRRHLIEIPDQRDQLIGKSLKSLAEVVLRAANCASDAEDRGRNPEEQQRDDDTQDTRRDVVPWGRNIHRAHKQRIRDQCQNWDGRHAETYLPADAWRTPPLDLSPRVRHLHGA